MRRRTGIAVLGLLALLVIGDAAQACGGRRRGGCQSYTYSGAGGMWGGCGGGGGGCGGYGGGGSMGGGYGYGYGGYSGGYAAPVTTGYAPPAPAPGCSTCGGVTGGYGGGTGGYGMPTMLAPSY